MAVDNTTIARPYAKAAFQSALDTGNIDDWSYCLTRSAFASQTKEVVMLINHPDTDKKKLVQLFIEVSAKDNNEKQARFFQILADNHRLGVLTDIAVLFEHYKAQKENLAHVEVVSHMPMIDSQRSDLIEKLSEKLKRDISLECSVDETLLGGAIIKAGDLVFDGSVKTQLHKLGQDLQN